jgi:hypothetical protein
MAEVTIDGRSYLSLRDVATVLSKKEPALRARIKRGSLGAVQVALPSSPTGAKRFRYMIPLDSVTRELEAMVRRDPVLHQARDTGTAPNLYQVLYRELSGQPEGLTLSDLRWQLERYFGLSLTEDGVAQFLRAFSEFAEAGGRYVVARSPAYQTPSARAASQIREGRSNAIRTLDEAGTAQAVLREYGQRIAALESKIETLIDLLSKRLGPGT